jgi:hypothetical protein
MCAVAGALTGLLLTTATSIANPFVAVLALSVLGALVGYASGERTTNGMLTLRLLMAGVWLAVGIGDPTALGVAALAFGGAFGLLAIVDARRAARLERARARVTDLREAGIRYDI